MTHQNPISQNIANYFSNAPNVNYIIKEGPMGDLDGYTEPTADCDSNGTCHFTTVLNDQMIYNGNDLAIAKTMLHESMHGYLNALFNMNPGLMNFLAAGTSNDDFFALANAYADFLAQENPQNYAGDLDQLSHQYMQDFVDEMEAAMLDIGQQLGYDLSDPQLQNPYLRELILSGSMTNSTLFHNEYGYNSDGDYDYILYLQQVHRINALGLAEVTGQPQSYGTIDSQGYEVSPFTTIQPIANQVAANSDPSVNCYEN